MFTKVFPVPLSSSSFLSMKIGSFFIAGFSGTQVPKWLKAAIFQHDLFGVILFARNFSNAEQVLMLCAELQTLKKQVSTDPLLIGLDHEGGFVTRACDIIPGFPSALAQSKGGTLEATRVFFSHAGLTMRALGMNCNFAPVLDLLPKRGSSSIGIRSFGSDPKIVAAFGASALQGMSDAGILACGKHFPGLGSAKLDSHETLPTVSKSKKNLLSQDFFPFRELIKIPMLMTAHAFYPALETEKIPATFSKMINQDLLRRKMNFKGVLVSDDLGMGAVTERFSIEEAALRAISSGIDLALVCHAEEETLGILNSLREIFFERIPEPVLVKSAERKRMLFRHLKKMESKTLIKIKPRALTDKDQFLKLRRKIAKNVFEVFQTRSTTTTNPQVLFSEKSILVLALPGWIPKGVEETPPALNRFFQKMQKRFPGSEMRVLKTAEAMKKFAGGKIKKQILLLAKDLACHAPQRSFVEKLVSGKSGKIVCAVCVKNPEDAHFLKHFADNVVCTLGFDEENWDAALDFCAKR